MQKLLWVSCFLTAIYGFSHAQTAKYKIRTLVIDAGHGGKDPGCLGEFSHEKDVALSISLKLGGLIERHFPHVKVIYTRRTDVFIPLRQRAQIANKAGADLFISIHCNAHEARSKHGTETYVMGTNSSKSNLSVAMRENSAIFQEANYKASYGGFDPTSAVSYILLSNYQTAHQANSLHIASNVEQYFMKDTKRESRGVKQSGFWVLAKTGMPSILVETGFLTNAEEEKYLNSEKGQWLIAGSIYRAFRDYCEY